MEVEDEKGRRLTGNEAAALARGRIADARSGMVCACVERSLGRGVMDVIPVGKSFFSYFAHRLTCSLSAKIAIFSVGNEVFPD
jgi:hypothetical protein